MTKVGEPRQREQPQIRVKHHSRAVDGAPFRMFVAAAAALLLASTIPAALAETTTDRGIGGRSSPNVVVIVIDTLRVDRLGCYGSDLGATPRIDRFAEQSVVFEKAYSHAPWTLPSLASLFTSQVPLQHRADGMGNRFRALAEESVTLAEIFQDASYLTSGVFNVRFLSESFGMTQGLDHVDVHLGDHNLDARQATGTTDAALEWLDEVGSEPFLLLVHYFDPHLVYEPPQPFRRRFAAPEDRETADPVFGDGRQMIAYHTGRLQIAGEVIRRLEGLYNGEVAHTDAEVGRLLDGLEERGLGATTIVVLLSDHGEEFLDHGRFEHAHSLYDELLHVPLVVRAPGIDAGRVRSTVGLMDVAPTLCELTDLDVPSVFAGVGMHDLMLGQEGPDRPVYSQGNLWRPSGFSWREGPYKLVVTPAFKETERRIELYDVAGDPRERRDLSSLQPERASRMLETAEAYQRWARQQATPEVPAEISPEDKARLRALGYLE